MTAKKLRSFRLGEIHWNMVQDFAEKKGLNLTQALEQIIAAAWHGENSIAQPVEKPEQKAPYIKGADVVCPVSEEEPVKRVSKLKRLLDRRKY